MPGVEPSGPPPRRSPPARALQTARSVLRLGSAAARGWLTGRGAPLQAFLVLTHRCNGSCLYCGLPRLGTPDLPVEAWRDLADQLAALGCRRATLLGGEPLLYAGVGRLAARLRERGIAVNLTSNGRLAPRRPEVLRRLDSLVLSLDAAGPANDLVRGEGAYAAVLAALEAARAHGVPVKLNAVLSAANGPHLDGLLAFAAARRLPLAVGVVRSGDPVLWGRAREVKPPDREIRRLLVRLAREAVGNPWLVYSPRSFLLAARWPDYGVDCLAQGQSLWGVPAGELSPPCAAGRWYFTIDPQGRVSPCCVHQGRPDNPSALELGLARAWRLAGEHDCRACYSPCLLEQNFLYAGHPVVLHSFLRRHLRRMV
ncbi:MAG: radical SAM protein [Deltaproteobacteria bacterium]|nr:radical SAM protein [Deltaproteobacteria bacterium]